MSVLSTRREANGQGSAARPSRPWQLTWLVASREIRLRARTRAFVITTAVLLIAVALAVALPAILSSKNKPDRIGVVGDNTAISGIVTERAGCPAARRSRFRSRAWRRRTRRCAAVT